MKTYGKHLFWIFWVVMAGVTALIYFRYDTNSDFIGLVENRTHILGMQESGVVAKIAVAQGDQVKAGQVLVVLDMADLDREKKVLEDELGRLQEHLGADRARAGFEYDKLATQSEADSLNVNMRRADLAEKTAELESVKTEIDRLQAAENAGLGRSRELSDLIIRRDTLSRVVSAQRAVLADSRPVRSGARGDAREQMVQSMQGDSLARIGEIKVALSLLESRRAMRTIVAPADGRVVLLVNRPGDTVERYLPVVTLEEDGAEYVDVYVPETSGQIPMVGARVNLFPHRYMAPDTTGIIVSVDPGYSVIPDRLAFRGQFYWARKFRVQMADDHRLMPGEAVRVELIGHPIGVQDAVAYAIDHGAARGDAGKESSDGADETGPRTITFAGPEGARGAFEPSGAVWLADIERYLIVSDDTGAKGNRHVPWLFMMDKDGVVDAEPSVLSGVSAVNDLEAVTMAPDGTIYLVSSNNLNKKGVRKPVRQQVYMVGREGRNLSVKGSVALADAIAASYNASTIAALGLSLDRQGKVGELNIEGAAWSGDALLFGLKQPVGDSGAVIWRLENPEGLIKKGRLEPGQLSVYRRIDLGVVQGRMAGFSDLFLAADGTLYAASTIPKVPDSAQIGRIFRLEFAREGNFRAVELAAFPGLKPEGICQADEDALTVFFDTGAAQAKFTTVGIGR